MTDFKKLGLYVMAACLTFSLGACSDDDEGNEPVEHKTPSGPTNFTAEPMAAYAAKYEVKTTGSEYESFEFLADGTYIITRTGYNSSTQKKEEPAVSTDGKKSLARAFRKAMRASRAETDNGFYIYGTYSVRTDGTYILENGDKVVISADATTISFTHHGIISTVSVQKTQQTTAGKNTQNLCRSWKCERMEVYAYNNNILVFRFNYNALTKKYDSYYFHPALREDGETDKDLLREYGVESYDGGMPTKIVFSPAYTYFVTYEDGQTEKCSWAWSNEANGTFYYDWDDELDFDNAGYCNVTFNGKKAYVKEDYSGYEDGEHYREVAITTLGAL